MTDSIDLQAEMLTGLLDQEERLRHQMVVALAGARAYGFPSPDSGFDLEAIHIEPTARLLGFSAPRLHAARTELLDGLEIKYTSSEIGPVLAGILQGNGNYLERVLGALVMRSSPEHEALRTLVDGALSKRLHRHYQGFASGQLRDLEDAPSPTTTKLLYVLRTTLTGAHLLREGELITDVTGLLDRFGFGEARALVDAKAAGERVVLEGELRGHWIAEARRAVDVLELAYQRSPLPDEPENRDQLEEWLLALRRERFQE
ncbi:MAG: nucleotidyltransferase domain-containing protein [Myxococcales bacterium]|nr:nucleotidyltransferase domain-containing protein [Myxococcales bacterium]